ncbi:hypothetical protein [Patulibacter minatonensis]|uniref:hypothetical protein n=1 Tax=Patulibacter minatonensis TaxID=298163 RepID=UPI00047E2952|nr:hypothetical protein [Patulibacter minatonensis]
MTTSALLFRMTATAVVAAPVALFSTIAAASVATGRAAVAEEEAARLQTDMVRFAVSGERPARVLAHA